MSSNRSSNEEEQTPMTKVEFHDEDDGSITAVEVPVGTRVTEAAAKAGVYIPTLCHHPRLKPAGHCGLCVVSVEDGPAPTQLACSTGCHPSKRSSVMKVHVHGTYLNGLSNAALRRNLERSMVYRKFQSNNDFAACGSLEIEDLGKYMKHANVDRSSHSITFDPSLCTGCSRCVRACHQLQDMNVLEMPVPTVAPPAVGIAEAPPCMATKAGKQLKDTDCISCGQCTVFCPSGAIKEVDHVPRVMRALSDPNMMVVLQTAPSARVTISEMFGGKPGDCPEGRLVGAAKESGFDFVFDTLLTADLTIMEEANELLRRIEVAKIGSKDEREMMPLPMFTSCCPGWVNLVEQSYPHLLPHLSTCRSPMAMLSSIIRHHWWHKQAKKKGVEVDQSKLFVVAVMPCTAKKDEMHRPQLALPHGKPETDAVLTVREFARLIELRGVANRKDCNSLMSIPEVSYDDPLGESTGASVIFGVTGGVMEAALRTAADVLSGKELENIEYQSVRGLYGIKKSTVKLGASEEISLNVAVCHQMRNVREFLDEIDDGESNFHFIEVMTCPGGCIGGGGLPQSRDPDILSKRISSVYSLDEKKVKRKSHENASVKKLYKKLLNMPLSDVSHQLLHTRYIARPRERPMRIKDPHYIRSMEDYSMGSDSDSSRTINNGINVIYGTQSGTTANAAAEIEIQLKRFFRQNKVLPEPKVYLSAANSMPPEKLFHKMRSCSLTIFVVCTYGEGDFPDMFKKFWDHLEGYNDDVLRSMRYCVFGLGSTMYAAVEEQFNRAAKRLDCKLFELAGERIMPVCLADDLDSAFEYGPGQWYRGKLDNWMKELLPNIPDESTETNSIGLDERTVSSSGSD